MSSKKTLVLGASDNPSRYSYLAVTQLQSSMHPVVAIGNKKGQIGNTAIQISKISIDELDTITLYLNPSNQKEYYSYIVGLHPKRIIFNPGTENDELEQLASQQGILTMEACTLVMLSTGQY